MADAALKARIREVLTRAFAAPDDVVDVSDSDATEELVHIVVVSRRFEGRAMGDKADLISDELERALPLDDYGMVSLMIGATPAELNGATAADLKFV